ncbi:MAG: glycosyltransferase family A protein [Sedimenticola sp.]
MQISVIIPTHNRADLLERALKSVQAQTLPPLEVIVVDDGSEDHTREMVSEKFPRVRYLHQPNRGVSSARNLGISEARGDWIALLDSDDEWLASKLATQKTRLESQPGHHICHTEEIWFRNGKRVNQMKKHNKQGGAIFQHCLPLCVISPSSVLIHKSVFREVGLFDESLPACEDYDLWLRICARYPVTYVEQPQIVKYGGHEDQLSRRHWGMDRFRLHALEKIITSGDIEGDDLEAAKAMLARKAEILAKGAEKRGKHTEASNYRQLQQNHAPRQAGLN